MILSVILPVYNAEEYLEEAIKSVLNQTFIDFELIVINDGSKDDSLKIINSFTDSRIVVINQANKGLAATLNVGLSIARGKYIARMDADDVCVPNRFELQLDYLKKHSNVKLLGGAVEIIDADSHSLGVDPPYIGDKFLKKFLLKVGNPFKHPTVIFDRDVALECGGYNENIGKYFEDYFLWSKIAEKGAIANLTKVVLKYRITPNSIMSSIKSKEFSDFMLSVINRGEFNEEDKVQMNLIKTKDSVRMKGVDSKAIYEKRINSTLKSKMNIVYNFLVRSFGTRLALNVLIFFNRARYYRSLIN